MFFVILGVMGFIILFIFLEIFVFHYYFIIPIQVLLSDFAHKTIPKIHHIVLQHLPLSQD